MFGKTIFQKGVVLTLEIMEDLLADRGVDPSSLQLSQPHSNKLQQQWAHTHKLPPLQFLSALKTALVAEQHMIGFDYVSLHMRCFQLIDRLKKRYGEGYIENETQLACKGGWILFTAVYEDRAAQLMKQGDVSLHKVMLLSACQVLGDFIKREGDVECTELEKIYPQTNFQVLQL
ncbi:unnamed protein product [Calypogeia fissa]